jgi:hypothetical protein
MKKNHSSYPTHIPQNELHNGLSSISKAQRLIYLLISSRVTIIYENERYG